MKTIYLLLLTGLASSTVSSQILVGQHASSVKNLTLTDSTIDLLIESAQTKTVVIGSLDSVTMQVLLDDKGIINYISTNDQKFMSGEGLKVGDTFKKVITNCRGKAKDLIKMPGWGTYIKLKSGWNAVFDFKKPIDQSSEILFFYQKL